MSKDNPGSCSEGIAQFYLAQIQTRIASVDMTVRLVCVAAGDADFFGEAKAGPGMEEKEDRPTKIEVSQDIILESPDSDTQESKDL